MATWNPANILLTDTGAEILSKVQVGDGSIDVARIVVGGSSVPYEKLHSLTQIPDIKQELTILSSSSTQDGSIINTSLNNESISEAYELYTIGIYVTHPSYTGEQLYLVAECDTDAPDRIPLQTDTPILLQYDIYMIHSGTNNVTINVTRTEYLPITGGTLYGDLFVLGYVRINNEPSEYSDAVTIGYANRTYVRVEQVGQPGGVAPIGDDGLVPAQFLPKLTDVGVFFQTYYNSNGGEA